MGNIQSDNKKNTTGKSQVRNLLKTKKSPVKELFKYQTITGKKQKQSNDVQDQPSVSELSSGDVGNSGTDLMETSLESAVAIETCDRFVVTDSWLRVRKLQQSFDNIPVEESSVTTPSSEESVFTDPLLTPVNSDSKRPEITVKIDDESDEITLTMDCEDDEIPVILKQRRPQTHSLDALEEEILSSEKTKSLDLLEEKESGVSKMATSFTVVRHRKVELVPTKLSEQCLVSSGKEVGSDLRRHSSVSDVPLDSNVLRKVASLTLDKATLEQKVIKPKFVPEKLDFQLYEKFEGQMLINWFVSAFADDHYLRFCLKTQDFRVLAAQFCTHLLAAGVLRQLPDKDVPQDEALFRPDLIYYWSHTEVINTSPTPGKLQTLAWPPAVFTQDVILEYNGNHSSVTGIEAKKHEAETITELVRKLNEQKAKITELEAIVEKLNQEKERSKTLADIQLLAERVRADFNSPEKENKSVCSPIVALKTSEAVQNGLKLKTSPPSPSCRDELEKSLEPESMVSERLHKIDDSPQLSGVVSQATTSFPSLDILEKSSRSLSVSESMAPSTLLVIPSTTPSLKPEIALSPPSLKEKVIPPPPPPMPEMVSPPPSLSETVSPPPTIPAPPTIAEISPPLPSALSEITLSSPLKLEVGPPPPLMPEISPPSPCMGPSPPPMGVTCPSHVMGPTPPSPSEMGPPPPPMPGMGPPPPPMPGMGPPPPPMPGMGPPPPPMPGMGPPPPPMPGMGPPPPPMPGMGPPPPMPGMGPPPPPMPGMGPPPPPMPGMGPPPPPMPGMGPPPPPPIPGMASPPPPSPSSGNNAPTPFPTPPVGGWNAQRAMFRKQPVNPPTAMKPLYWTRLVIPTPPVDVSTAPNLTVPLWGELEEAKIEDLDEFAQLFSRQVVDRKNTKKNVVVKPTKAQVIKILDSKRSQNVGILAQSLHLDFTEIENAIYNFDTSVVNLEALQQIYDVRATEEELSLIRTHVTAHPDQPLDKPEQFLLELAEIPHFAERIACFMFQSEFSDNVTSIENKLNNIKSTCEFLMSSESLKAVLSIILALGNYMNGGNRQRGQADGFGLEILSKLKDVKSKDNLMTLLHYIVRAYMKQCDYAVNPDLALPVPEPGDIDRAASVQFEDIELYLNNLDKELNGCQKKMETVIAKSLDENLQPFKDKMEAFLTTAQKQLAEEFENCEECKRKFQGTLRFYHFQPRGGMKAEEVAPKDFFPLWGPFCSDFKDLWKKEQQRIIKEKMKEAKRKQFERKQEIKKGKINEGGLKARLKRLESKFKSET